MSDRAGERRDSSAEPSADLDSFGNALRSAGYDVEPPRPGDPPGGTVVARRDLGDRVILCSIDSAGRFLIEITWLVGEWPSRQDISGVPVRLVDRVTRSVSVAGQIDEARQLALLLAGLGEIVPWASGSADEDPEPAEQPPEP